MILRSWPCSICACPACAALTPLKPAFAAQLPPPLHIPYDAWVQGSHDALAFSGGGEVSFDGVHDNYYDAAAGLSSEQSPSFVHQYTNTDVYQHTPLSPALAQLPIPNSMAHTPASPRAHVFAVAPVTLCCINADATLLCCVQWACCISVSCQIAVPAVVTSPVAPQRTHLLLMTTLMTYTLVKSHQLTPTNFNCAAVRCDGVSMLWPPLWNQFLCWLCWMLLQSCRVLIDSKKCTAVLDACKDVLATVTITPHDSVTSLLGRVNSSIAESLTASGDKRLGITICLAGFFQHGYDSLFNLIYPDRHVAFTRIAAYRDGDQQLQVTSRSPHQSRSHDASVVLMNAG